MRYFTAEELRNSHKKEVAEKLSQCAAKNVRYNFGIKVIKKLVRTLNLGFDIKILDLGTAGGMFLEQLAQNGFRNVYAHDIVDYLPEKKRLLVKEYKLSELSTDKMPWPDNFFDIVTAWCVIPHLENPFHCAREVLRILKPGGIFIFTTPHILSKPSVDFFLTHRYFASYRPTNNHIALLPLSILEKTLFRGFKLLETDYLVTPKVFRDLKGKLRELAFAVGKKFPKLENYLKYRWGYNVCYILAKTI
ncbi:MAG TPA: methyltransferase domain-containing protein [Candidatus Paceibacterota bacterium]